LLAASAELFRDNQKDNLSFAIKFRATKKNLRDFSLISACPDEITTSNGKITSANK
jgi:hypothetical protein